jgi:hypothetical protein
MRVSFSLNIVSVHIVSVQGTIGTLWPATISADSAGFGTKLGPNLGRIWQHGRDWH